MVIGRLYPYCGQEFLTQQSRVLIVASDNLLLSLGMTPLCIVLKFLLFDLN